MEVEPPSTTSQIDYIPNSEMLNEQEKEFSKTVDRLNEDYTETDLPNKLRKLVIISESSSGQKAQAGKSSIRKALTCSVKKGPALNKIFRAQSRSSPIHRITWDGCDETCESDGQTCPLCEKDLSTPTLDKDEFEHYDRYLGPVNLPDVAILACGHAFHSECLESISPEDQHRDPPCFFCLSYIT